MTVFNIFILPAEAAANHHKEHRWPKKIASTVAVIIPPITPVPTAFCAPEPAPELITSGQYLEDKCQ